MFFGLCWETNKMRESPRRIAYISERDIMMMMSVCVCWQSLMGGWLFHYSLKCQPVDYSDDPVAIRVSLLYNIGKKQNLQNSLFYLLSVDTPLPPQSILQNYDY